MNSSFRSNVCGVRYYWILKSSQTLHLCDVMSQSPMLRNSPIKVWTIPIRLRIPGEEWKKENLRCLYFEIVFLNSSILNCIWESICMDYQTALWEIEYIRRPSIFLCMTQSRNTTYWGHSTIKQKIALTKPLNRYLRAVLEKLWMESFQ